jgi:hypothetical protein
MKPGILPTEKTIKYRQNRQNTGKETVGFIHFERGYFPVFD